MKELIPENKLNVYAYKDGNYIHYSEFILDIKDNYTTAPESEVLKTIVSDLKQCRNEINQRIKIVEDVINLINQKKLF